jgi:hypothetical protein
MNIPRAKIELFTDEESPTMKAVWLDVENKRLLATDGHMACRLSITVGEDDVTGFVPSEAFQLARKELKEITKLVGKNTLPDPWLQVICNSDAIFIRNQLTNTTHIVPRPALDKDQHFPNVDGVYPKLTGEPQFSVNPALLAEVIKSMEPELSCLSMWFQGPEKAALLAAPGGSAAIVVMPMKCETDASEVVRRGKASSASSLSEVIQQTADMVNAGALDGSGVTVRAEVIP